MKAISSVRLRRPQFNLKLIGAVVVAALLAILFGLLAVTNSPVLIGLGAAMVMAPILLVVPEVTIWIVLVVGFLGGVLSASPQLSKLAWAVSLLSMLLLVPCVANLIWSQRRRLPGFLTLALLFMVFSVAVTVLRWYSLEQFIAGFKRYFQAYGLMCALTLLIFTPPVLARWRKFMIVVALLQFPFALYELLVLVPMRGGVSLSSYTTDVVAGTFGANLQGGSPNSVMVIFLLIAVAFMAARWRAGLLSSRSFYTWAVISLLPLGMGETKFAVVILPVVGLSLLRVDLLRQPVRYLPALAGLGFGTAVLGYVYVVLMMNSTVADVIDSTLRYNVGNQGYSSSMVLNRMTSMTFWFSQQSLDNPLGFLVGNGLGSSYTSEGMGSGHVAALYPNYGINLTAISTLLWDTGLVGTLLYSSIFLASWLAAGRLYREVVNPVVKADALAIQAANTMFVFCLFYSDSIVNLVSMELVYAVVLGYQGYLMNLHGLLGPRQPTRRSVAEYAR